MIVRSAILEGTVKPEDSERFDRAMRDEIVPLMKQFPGVKSVRVVRAKTIEDDGLPIHMIFESVYESVDAMNEAFKAPVRTVLKAKIKSIMEMFDGRMFHITQELLADETV